MTDDKYFRRACVCMSLIGAVIEVYLVIELARWLA